MMPIMNSLQAPKSVLTHAVPGMLAFFVLFAAVRAAGEETDMIPRVSTKDRKVACMQKWVNAWKQAGYPPTATDREWKFDEIEPAWAAAHSALLLGGLEEEAAAANEFLASMYVDWKVDPDMRVCEAAASYFQLGPLDRLTPEARNRLREIIVGRPAPDRRSFTSWQMFSSENHTLMGHIWRLAAAMIQEETAEVDRMCSVIDEFVDDRAIYGWYEHASPCYVEKEVGCLLFLRAHAPVPELRSKAELALDLLLAEYALLSIDGIYGGPMARVYGEETDNPEYNHNSRRDRAASGTYAVGTILFGAGQDRSYGVLGQPLLVFSDYDPPELLVRIATERDSFGAFELRGRIPGSRVGEIKQLDSLPEGIDTFMHGRIYAYVTPRYILGSSQEVPERFRILTPRSLRTSLILKGDPKKAFYTDFERERWDTIFQYKNVQIVRGSAGRAYFPLDLLVETFDNNGWVFGRDEQVYFGFHVVSGTHEWEGVHFSDVYGDYVRYQPDSPTILEVAEAEDYGRDFRLFQEDLLGNPVAWDGKTLVYETGSEGKRGPSAETFRIELTLGEIPVVHTSEPDAQVSAAQLEDYPRFGSPYLRSAYGSGVHVIQFHGERIEYRFASRQPASARHTTLILEP
jgi:hypothetical protein